VEVIIGDFRMIKREGKVFIVRNMRTYGGSRGIAPPVLNVGTRLRCAVNFTPRPFYPREGLHPVSFEDSKMTFRIFQNLCYPELKF